MHWECVSVGRVNPDIFRKVKQVKFLRKRMWRRRQKHGNSGTHPAALAAPSVNCCLETKQLSSLFFFLFLSLFIVAAKPTIFIMFAFKRSSGKLLGWIGRRIFRYYSWHFCNHALIVASTCPENYWTQTVGVVDRRKVLFPYGWKFFATFLQISQRHRINQSAAMWRQWLVFIC